MGVLRLNRGADGPRSRKVKAGGRSYEWGTNVVFCDSQVRAGVPGSLYISLRRLFSKVPTNSWEHRENLLTSFLIIGGLEKKVPWYVRRCEPSGVRCTSGALQEATGTAVGLTVPEGMLPQRQVAPNRHARVVRCRSPVSCSSASSPRDRLAAVLRRWDFAEG